METVTIDITGWTQDQIIQVHASSVGLLYDASITYDSISVVKTSATDVEIRVENPSSAISSAVTQTTVSNRVSADIQARQDANDASATERSLWATGSDSSGLSGITKADFDTNIDAITTLDEAKAMIKKMGHYILYRLRG